MKFRLGLVIALTIAGCGELPEGDSKEGKESDGDGAPSNETDKGAEGTKSGPTAGDRTEIVNPELKLKRAYYKVFKNEEVAGTCYFLPRPDHTATAVAECDKKSDLGKKREGTGCPSLPTNGCTKEAS